MADAYVRNDISKIFLKIDIDIHKMENSVNNTTSYTSVFDATSSITNLMWVGTIVGSIW